MTSRRVLTWRVTESGGFETAWITLVDRTLAARVRTVGLSPEPWWVGYELACDDGYVTRRLQLTVETSASTRHLDLRHDGGHWTANGQFLPDLTGALDCDVAFSPLTNTMPILRHGLHLGPGERHFRIAFVSLPDLTVELSEQTYTHLGGGRVRFTSGDYTSDLTVDGDGLVIDYPEMAYRI